MNLYHGKIEDAVVRAVIQGYDGISYKSMSSAWDLAALIDTRQVVE